VRFSCTRFNGRRLYEQLPNQNELPHALGNTWKYGSKAQKIGEIRFTEKMPITSLDESRA
jgi:hypothetical protein